MSGNPALDAQIMQAVQPRFNPMQAINQMQRPPVQMQPMQPMPVENPVFGGAIPMNFGLPMASQIPVGYTPRLAAFQPNQTVKPLAQDVSSVSNAVNQSNSNAVNQSNGGYQGGF